MHRHLQVSNNYFLLTCKCLTFFQGLVHRELNVGAELWQIIRSRRVWAGLSNLQTLLSWTQFRGSAMNLCGYTIGRYSFIWILSRHWPKTTHLLHIHRLGPESSFAFRKAFEILCSVWWHLRNAQLRVGGRHLGLALASLRAWDRHPRWHQPGPQDPQVGGWMDAVLKNAWRWGLTVVCFFTISVRKHYPWRKLLISIAELIHLGENDSGMVETL